MSALDHCQLRDALAEYSPESPLGKELIQDGSLNIRPATEKEILLDRDDTIAQLNTMVEEATQKLATLAAKPSEEMIIEVDGVAEYDERFELMRSVTLTKERGDNQFFAIRVTFFDQQFHLFTDLKRFFKGDYVKQGIAKVRNIDHEWDWGSSWDMRVIDGIIREVLHEKSNGDEEQAHKEIRAKQGDMFKQALQRNKGKIEHTIKDWLAIQGM